MSDAITSTKLEQTGKIFWDSRCCFECIGICVLSPADESEMKGYLVYVLIVKKRQTYLIDFVSIQPQYIRLNSLIVEFGGDFLKHF